MSGNVWWHIFNVANHIDERRQRIQERRRARRLARQGHNPFNIPSAEFLKTYRLSKDAVAGLINDISPLMRRERRRDGISTTLKILITLAFYATGSYQTIVGQSSFHNVCQTTVSRSIKEVTEALNDRTIYNKYIKWPRTIDERNLLKQRFFQKYGFPGAIGSIDGTHVAIIKPVEHEERYVNRKGFHSLNVLIICDADLKILCIDPSSPGSAHDSRVWAQHPLNTHLNELSNNGETVFLLGDSGYPLRQTMVTPILNAPPGSPEFYFYTKHVTARSSIERCIGVLKQRFRCLLMARALHYAPVKAAKIVNACAVLHNIAMSTNNEPLPPTEAETASAENILRQQFALLDEAAELRTQRVAQGRPNPALEAGRSLQQALVERLWRRTAA